LLSTELNIDVEKVIKKKIEFTRERFEMQARAEDQSAKN